MNVATPSIEVEEVRAALSTTAVLECYGWQYRKSGDEYESSGCPTRSDHTRRAFVINAKTGRWRCFPCTTSGDLFDFIAAAERLSMPADFRAVLAKAAEIAGVGPSTLTPDEKRQRRDQWHLRQRQLEAQERQERRARDKAAVPIATAYWSALLPQHARGIEYLRERGVEDVIQIRDLVRFDPRHDGSPAIVLYASNGNIRNVVARRLPELGEPKTPGLYRCPSAGTFVNAIAHIESDRDVVLTEGVIDSLTARLAWTSAIVLGAHGASNLPKVVRIAAPAVANAQSRLLVVAHRDSAGFDCASDACRLAVDAGLSVRKGTLQIIKHGEKDLNDAWRRGWRPSA